MSTVSNVTGPQTTDVTGTTDDANSATRTTGSDAATATAAASLAQRALVQILPADDRGKGFDSPHSEKEAAASTTPEETEDPSEGAHEDLLDDLGDDD